jgi:hypothetical protein
MSIVGTQSVSMADLMKLGVPALNAMAQGQQQSIAPSYMVLAALKSLTDQQKGQMTQQPQGTVKDAVIAQATPPMQAGIAQMAPPVQRMAGGGSVETPGWKMLADWIAAGRPSLNKPIIDHIGDWFKGTPDPTERVGTEKGRKTNTGNAVTQATSATDYGNEGRRVPAALPVMGGEDAQPVRDLTDTSVGRSISASARSRGIGSANGPLGKYSKMGPTPTADSFKLDIPRNEQLIAAAEKFSKPDEARMQELRDAESRAGLAAFARSMVDPKRRGFGAAFGSAAADYVDAKESKAEKRREYEDKREAIATQLGIQVGAEAKQDFLAKSEWGAKRADEAFNQGIRKLQVENEATRFGNQDTLDLRKIDAQMAAIKEQALARKDNNLLQRITMLQNGKMQAEDNARKRVIEQYSKRPQFALPEVQAEAQYEAERAAANAGREFLIPLKPLLKQYGIPTE